MAPEPNFIGPPSLIWGDADVLCAGPLETLADHSTIDSDMSLHMSI